jgi:hypothetical protein
MVPGAGPGRPRPGPCPLTGRGPGHARQARRQLGAGRPIRQPAMQGRRGREGCDDALCPHYLSRVTWVGKSALALELAGRGVLATDPDDDPQLSYWEDAADHRVSEPLCPDQQWLVSHRGYAHQPAQAVGPGRGRRGQHRRHYSCPEQSAGSESSGQGSGAGRGRRVDTHER